DQLGDAEVEQPNTTVGVDQDVGRLEVAVHDELAVRMLDRGADIEEPAHACANAEASGIAPARERIAAHELEGEPGPTVGCHTAVDEAREVGMVEAGEDAALAQEAGLHVVEVEAAA